MHQWFYCDGLIDVYDLTLRSCAFADIRYSKESFKIKTGESMAFFQEIVRLTISVAHTAVRAARLAELLAATENCDSSGSPSFVLGKNSYNMRKPLFIFVSHQNRSLRVNA